MKKNGNRRGVAPNAASNKAERPTAFEVEFDLKALPNADKIPYELYDQLRKFREWRDRSAHSTVLVG